VSGAPVADRAEMQTHTPRPAPAQSRFLDRAIRAVGLLVAVGLAGASALYEAFLAGLRWNQVRVPVALVLAIAANLLLIWFTRYVTGRAVLVAVPAVVWVAIMIIGSQRTAEGDLVLTESNWVGLTTLLAGSLVYALGGYWLITHAGLAGAAKSRRDGPSAA
jgi:hypothetical protein